MNRTRLALLLALVVSLFVLPGQAQGWSNGQAPASAVSPIKIGFSCPDLGGQLENHAAAGWNTMALASGRPIPVNGCDSAYRSLARQFFWRNFWCGQGACGNAALPGTSNHGLGLAVDVPQWVRGLIDQRGARFGFCKCWSDAPWEWWHVKFNPTAFHRPNPGLDLHSPLLRRHSGGPGQRPWVKKVQRLLRSHGYRGVTADGQFGRRTHRAVRKFQRSVHLRDDGVVGHRTWNRLRNRGSARVSSVAFRSTRVTDRKALARKAPAVADEEPLTAITSPEGDVGSEPPEVTLIRDLGKVILDIYTLAGRAP